MTARGRAITPAMREARLSVVIPALDAAAVLPATLAALEEGRRSGLVEEVLLVDGGSADGTADLAEAAGATVIAAQQADRGQQLAQGAQSAQAPWLLFLHADTRLTAGWAAVARRFIENPLAIDRAAYFRLQLDDPAREARWIERLANWRAQRLGLPYGDQGLLIGRDFYDVLGGYSPIPLMEDVDLARRVGRRHLVALSARAVTSAERYRRDGWWLRPLRNLSILTLYFIGLPPAWLRRLYG